MKITKFKALPVTVPFREPFNSAFGIQDAKYHVIVQLESENGVKGYGECAPFPPLGFDQVSCLITLNQFVAPVLVDHDLTNLNAIIQKVGRVTPGNPFVQAAIEMALYDLWGKQLGLSVSTLLGGKIRDRIPVAAVIPLGPRDFVVRKASVAVEEGFHCIKLKLGAEAMESIETVRAVRRAIGFEIKLRLDPNGSWTAPTTISTLRRLEDQNIELIEQPVPRYDWFGLIAVARSTSIPLLVDESIFDVTDAARLIAMGFRGIANVKVDEAGGLRKAMKTIEFCEVMGIPTLIGSMITTAIGSAASLHTASVQANVIYPSEMIGSTLLVTDLAISPLQVLEGYLQVPTDPGLGINVDEEALAFHSKN